LAFIDFNGKGSPKIKKFLLQLFFAPYIEISSIKFIFNNMLFKLNYVSHIN